MVKEWFRRHPELVSGSLFFLIIGVFLLLSFAPTILDLSLRNSLSDTRREFTLEHNYYWPDYNLYLSKIRQGLDGKWLAKERYTSEPHTGSLIQILYVTLGQLGRLANADVTASYLLGRIIFAPLLLLVILKLVKTYFKNFSSQIFVFLVVLMSGSFLNITTNEAGQTVIGRFMDFWSNMDALQRITHLPHILAAQVLTFFLLYRLLIRVIPAQAGIHDSPHQFQRWIPAFAGMTGYVLLGNIMGLIFPPSLMTLDLVIILTCIIPIIKKAILKNNINLYSEFYILNSIFLFLTLPSLLYIFFLTKTVPWASLVQAHQMTRMPVAMDQFTLATGPIWYLSIAGIVWVILKRRVIFYPIIYFVASTLLLAAYFSFVNDQSPLRFTQTGLFIPFGILGSYFLVEVWEKLRISKLEFRNLVKMFYAIGVMIFFVISLLAMKSSWDWQQHFYIQESEADHPLVPYPPQSLHPLSKWMDAIRYLGLNSNNDDAVIAEIAAANYIPVYAGNTVWWGQTNTYDYFRKLKLMEDFFSGNLSEAAANHLFKEGHIRYVFVGPQEKEKLKDKSILDIYPNLKLFYHNDYVDIYSTDI